MTNKTDTAPVGEELAKTLELIAANGFGAYPTHNKLVADAAKLIRRLTQERDEARAKALEDAIAIADRVRDEHKQRGLSNIHGFADSDGGARNACEIVARRIRALLPSPKASEK